MHTSIRRGIFATLIIFLSFSVPGLWAQSAVNSGTINGTVTDPSGAVIPGAKVSILNPVSGYTRSTVTDGAGRYQFNNIPFSPYHLTVSAAGFETSATDVQVSSMVTIALTNTLKIGANATEISVDASDLTRNDSGLQTEIDRSVFDKLTVESQSSALSSIVTQSSPGVAAD